MKKNFLIALVCCVHCAFAQKSFFGVDAGVNVANQREHVSQTMSNTNEGITIFFNNSIKPTFGVFYQYGFNEKMGLRLNVQYMGLGYVNKGATIDKLTINYLTLPLTFHYHVNKHLSFNTGPYLSFTLGGTKINDQPVTKTYHHNDRGFSFGAEHDIYKNLVISVNYVFGLMNVWLDDTERIDSLPPITVHTKYTNRALQFTLIYKFKKEN